MKYNSKKHLVAQVYLYLSSPMKGDRYWYEDILQISSALADKENMEEWKTVLSRLIDTNSTFTTEAGSTVYNLIEKFWKDRCNKDEYIKMKMEVK